ncbi:MAG: hypothetical protein WAP35_10320 [Solirubrobacterales bacterium]
MVPLWTVQTFRVRRLHESSRFNLELLRRVAAQQRIDRGEAAPLLGVPIAIKHDTDIAGHVTRPPLADELN